MVKKENDFIDDGSDSEQEDRKPSKSMKKQSSSSTDSDRKGKGPASKDSKANVKEEEVKPAAKKRKVEDDEEQEDSKESTFTPEVKTTSEGERYVELNQYKRVTVRQFKGKTLIDIRDFYNDKKSGEMKPTAKGIALSPELWNALKASQAFLLTNDPYALSSVAFTFPSVLSQIDEEVQRLESSS
ncbi:PC4-domain-containing protein [Cystobasidium minutum MCA 4210]|uniref:PC4-domain-containing protein n=1 Tax=Cystobasidium minutum MCA 4210 TaxID=1397322 RepID=UPI0034CF3893|eukprot:jgi/Rhomi1/178974/fgenesh1_pg.3_\